jgi:light-regulated signal transduction histidine kinase (bacteriophytochrome)
MAYRFRGDEARRQYVLRGVSPIHVEYPQNIGVGASMSVSIVGGVRLWGLIACHHTGPKRVPYSVRMAADVLAQVIASTVQGIEAREDAAQVRTNLVDSLLLEDDPLEALVQHGDGLLESAHTRALIVSRFGRVVCRGVDQALGEAIVASLPPEASDVVTYGCVKEWPDAIRPLLGKWAGLLGLPFDPPSGGWCIVLRTEQIEEVAWGGKPDKTQVGPMGERLTPRGSFGAWHETVRGRAQTEATRAQRLAMLGHDLRDPLNSINMAGMVLERTDIGSPIAPETEATLFNPFKRSALNNPRNRTGVGLGRHIARRIVREHEGEIAYRHENGKVVSSVRLPLAQRQAS